MGHYDFVEFFVGQPFTGKQNRVVVTRSLSAPNAERRARVPREVGKSVERRRNVLETACKI